MEDKRGIGLGSEVKERGTVVHARVTTEEYELLANISLLGGAKENPREANISEGIRFCINFTAKVLAILPETLVETVLDEKMREFTIREGSTEKERR